MSKKSLGSVCDNLASMLEALPLAIGDAYITKVKQRTPVDTGFLRKSWKIGDVSGNYVQVINDAPYAEYIENGTEKMAPRAMAAATTADFDSVIDLARKRIARDI